MEKASMTLSMLILSDVFMYLAWGMLGVLNMVFGSFLLRAKSRGEKELVEISPNFKNIEADYMVFSFLGIILIVLLGAIVWPSLDNWALINYGRKFYPSLVFFFSVYGIYQALFAIYKGVYPMGKVLAFIYDDIKVIRHAAKIQIISSVLLSVLAVLFFFMTSSRIQ